MMSLWVPNKGLDNTVVQKKRPWIAGHYLKWPAIGWALIILLFSGCATAPVKPEGPVTVAVWDLENVTADPAYPDLGELLAGKIIEKIKSVSDYKVVERQRLILALEELGVGSSTLADDATRLRVGRLIGAQRMIFGGYQVIGELMRIDIRLVEVETGKVLKAAERTVMASDINAWLQAAADAAAELLVD